MKKTVKDPKTITAYRPCVGVMLLNAKGQAWIGRRFDKQDDDGIGKWWQMPQGGIDEGEDPIAASLRELYEETGIKSAQFIEQASEKFKYDLPEKLIGKSWGGRYRGQIQNWVALRFTGDESEISLKVPGHSPEFDQWRWASAKEILELIVPFKKPVYEQVVRAFQHLLA